MTGIEAAAGSVISSVATPAASYFSRMFTSSKNLKEQYELLYEDMQSLLSNKEDKEREVRGNHQKYTKTSYKLWINRVSEAEGDVVKLTREYLKIESYARRHIRKRSRLSAKIDKKHNRVCKLLKEGQDLKDFLVDKPPGSVLMDQLPVPRITGYPTLRGALQQILDHLKNNRIRGIGVRGTKGVGKTTIMQNLFEHIKEKEIGPGKLFDKVVFVKVANEAHKLQEKIAKRMMVDQGKIREKLEREKYLLILDEVEKDFDLKRLGIPIVENGSKIVIATRFLHVCKLNMDEVVEVKQLSDEDAWKMFRDIVRASNPMVDSPEIQPLAELVCRRCSRLPLLIHLTANSFKLKESASSWRAGVEDLNIWPELENDGLGELFSFLESCYRELNDINMKKCFLHTSLYPPDSKVYTDYLVECWAAQGFLGDILKDERPRPYGNARDRGIDILEKLTNVSLLEKGDSMRYVWMNDLIRQIAWYISSKDPNFSIYLQHTEGSSNLPNSTSAPTWVSMIGTKSLNSLKNKNVSKIEMLLLQKNSDLATIPKRLLKETLRVLDLYSTNITLLPSSSLSKLTGLRALFLNRCLSLKSLPYKIKYLQSLDVLDIRDTNVIFIPRCIRRLTKLRCLRIPFDATDEKKVQNVDAISKLEKLEELTIQVISYSYPQWCIHANEVLQRVASLENLTTLECCFPSASILQKFLERSKSWKHDKQQYSFRFFVGCKSPRRLQIVESFKYEITKYLMYCNGQQKDDSIIGEVLPQTDAFELISHKDIQNLSNFVDMNRIRGLVIERCNEVSSIVAGGNIRNGFQIENKGLLPNLEQLYLENLLNLECAFRGPLHVETLSKVQILSLKNCPLLTEIFSNGAIQRFSELQELTIEDCSSIEELIILKEDSERERDLLPKLEMLQLINLPNLKMMIHSNLSHILAWSSLERLRIHQCPQLKTLPFDTNNAANLRSIQGRQEWWDGLEWTSNDNHNELHQRLQSIFAASNP